GACGMKISKEDYFGRVKQILEFLNGKHGDVVRQLNKDMEEAAEAMEYEKAAGLRDKIFAIKRINEKQQAERISKGDQDVVAFAMNEDEALFQVFFIRDGKMTGREHFMVYGVAEVEPSAIMTQFVTQFYSGTPFVPKELVLQYSIENEEVIGVWLEGERGKKVTITTPIKGDKLHLVKLAHNNAIIQLEQFGKHIKTEAQRTTGAMDEIRTALGIDTPINRIEAYDISNIQGFENVGSMVAFEGGRARRNDYRKFKIKSLARGEANDYGAMQEILHRRFKRYQNESGTGISTGSFSRLPDVIFIDGGKGHVSAASEVLKDMGIDIPICGMVKDDKHRTRALLYNGEEVALRLNSEGFRLVVRIQEEVHRFAIEYHRKLRQKTATKSVLDDIPGIGDARRKALMIRFGTIEAIKTATLEELEQTQGINKKAAKSIVDFFSGTPTSF
ncbi:MAG: excinuclease ABC subunit UvrC, partial [Defluviitaleaceae bacterium]|nr:excinuclease ABC subunit UvrC [Defluviitaleaceae bacterium]